MVNPNSTQALSCLSCNSVLNKSLVLNDLVHCVVKRVITFVLLVFILVAKRRQAFLNKEGFDRFGRNQLFAPLMKWEVIKNKALAIRKNAEPYEKAYNEIRESVQRRDDIREVLMSLPVAAKTQVDQEKERLTEARRIAVSQKGAYVKVRFE